MLKKLLKYDLVYLYKGLIIFYTISIFFACLTRMFLIVENSFIMNVLSKICSGITISMIFNILINNVIRLWVRFKKNLYEDESYLTHTLPTKKSDLLLSKTLSSVITLFTSIIFILFSLFIAFYSKELIDAITIMLSEIAEILNSNTMSIILAFFFVLFLEVLNMIQSGYTGIILGHRKNNNKMLASVIMGFISYLMTQVIVLLLVFSVALFNKDLMNLFFTINTLSFDNIKVFILLSIISYIIINIIVYFVNLMLFNKGVNVD